MFPDVLEFDVVMFGFVGHLSILKIRYASLVVLMEDGGTDLHAVPRDGWCGTGSLGAV